MPLAKFSDFAVQDVQLAGNKCKITEVLDHVIVITGWRTMQSKCDAEKTCLELQFEFTTPEGLPNGEKHICFTASVVLLRQVQMYRDKIPFLTTIVKRGNYFTFS